MTPQKTSSPRSGVFAQDDWSIQNTRARSLGFYCCLGLSVMGIAVAVFAALFAPAMWVIVAGGTAASIAFLLTARQLVAKYYVVEENLKTIFHVSTARWDPSTIVTLSAEHGAYWRRIILQRPRAVYFFSGPADLEASEAARSCWSERCREVPLRNGTKALDCSLFSTRFRVYGPS
ncbi:hypothetical protein [Leucobacter komagatae]|uniref:hypothetical protein n=1 Tax=Leucobacter komagatae TaxID=55969 RepID=UPI0012ED68D6|nr:hypothetical protein [Leucobacter komagatae]